jgi:uncharacterized protein YyaL (SSP411 family)
MAFVIYSLGVVYDRSDYIDLCKGMLQVVSKNLKMYPEYYASWCALGGLFANGTYEVAIMGKDAIDKIRSLQKNYLPDCIMMGGQREENLPLLESKLRENTTLIYVCTNRFCKNLLKVLNRR